MSATQKVPIKSEHPLWHGVEFRMPRRARKTRQTLPRRRQRRSQRGDVSPASSRASSRLRMRLPKPSGNVKRKKSKRLADKGEPRWRVASAKSMRIVQLPYHVSL